jgi:predicted Zn finger-like uncharacterized protein
MKDKQVQIKCKNCGAVFSTFLEQMAEHNAKIVCPKCGKIHEDRDVVSGTSTISPHS